MNYKNYLSYVFLVSSLFMTSCSNDENFVNNYSTKIEKYKAKYMEFPIPLAYSTTNPNPEIITLDYDNNDRIIKKNGDVIYGTPNSGILYLFSKNIFAEVQYSNNKITILKKLIDPATNSNYKKEIFISNNLIDKIVKYNPAESSEIDTVVFIYNNQKITKTIERNIFPKKESLYYYNTQNNLDSIVTRYYQYNPQTNVNYIDYTLKNRNKVIFTNYDDKENPLKKLIIFDESFYRAISSNNFKKIIYQNFDNNGNIIFSNQKEWNLLYQNGLVDFSQ